MRLFLYIVGCIIFLPGAIMTTSMLPSEKTMWPMAIISWGIVLFLALLAYGNIRNRKQAKIDAAETEALAAQAMSSPLTEIKPAQALLKAGEKAYGAIRGSLQEVQTVGYSAGTQGVSVRVAKGLTLRGGGMRAHAVKGMVSVASGELVITDRRVIFAGDRKSFAVENENLLNTTNYTDGFGFTDGKSTYTVTTSDRCGQVLFAAALHKVLRA